MLIHTAIGKGTLNTSNIMLSMNGSANVIAEKNKAYKVMLCDALHPPSDPIWVKDNLYVISSEIISHLIPLQLLIAPTQSLLEELKLH